MKVSLKYEVQKVQEVLSLKVLNFLKVLRLQCLKNSKTPKVMFKYYVSKAGGGGLSGVKIITNDY